jgi:hypothetical protein
MSSDSRARGPLLTFEQALQGHTSGALVFTEHLRRWLEVRPHLQLTLTAGRMPTGSALVSMVSLGWSYEHAPRGLEGTIATIQEVELAAWPLWTALGSAARQLEEKERHVAAEAAKKAQGKT